MTLRYLFQFVLGALEIGELDGHGKIRQYQHIEAGPMKMPLADSLLLRGLEVGARLLQAKTHWSLDQDLTDEQVSYVYQGLFTVVARTTLPYELTTEELADCRSQAQTRLLEAIETHRELELIVKERSLPIVFKNTQRKNKRRRFARPRT